MSKKKSVKIRAKTFFFIVITILFLSMNIKYTSAFSVPASGYFVQHGTTAVTGLAPTIQITPVSNISRAFIIVHQWENQRTTAVTVTPAVSMFSAYLLNESTIKLERTTNTGVIYVTWMVVEALNNEFTVQQGLKYVTLNAGVLTTTDIIPLSVNISNSLVWQTINTTAASDADDMQFAVNFSDSTHLNIFRGGGTSAISAKLRWTVVEWNTSKIDSIQTGFTNLAGNEDPATPKLQTLNNQVNKNHSFLLSQCIGTGANAACDQAATNAAIKNDTTIMFYTYDTANALARRCYYTLIDFGNFSGDREELINRTLDDDGVTASKTDSFVTTIVPNKSLAYVYSTASSTSTSTLRYPSGSVYYNITSLNITYLRMYVARSAASTNGQSIAWQVLELPFNYWPNVTSLTYPSNLLNVNTQLVFFNFTVSDADNNLINCTLWGNFSGVWEENKTLLNPNLTGVNTFNLTLDDGEYFWNVKCVDNYTDFSFYNTQNNTFYIDSAAPQIINPNFNESRINQTHVVRLNVNITDDHNLTVKTARITYPDTSFSDLSLTNTTGNSYYLDFNYTTQNGTYSLTSITATDTFTNTNITNYQTITFNVTLSPPNAFTLLLPQNATESRNLTPNMSWQQANDETFSNYSLLISTDQTFSTVNFNYTLFGQINTSKILNTSLLSNTVYYWKVTAKDTFDSLTESTDIFRYTTDLIAPSISLTAPQDNTFITTNTAVFNFTANDTNTLNTCTLYINLSGSFSPNISNQSLSKTNPNYLSTQITEGVYIWNMRCNDSAANANFSISNYTLKVDYTAPTLTLLSPAPNAYENTTNNVNFTINATERWSNLSSCKLIINGTATQTKTDVINGVQYSFIEYMPNANYTWQVNCTDTNGFVNQSSILNISVDFVDHDPPLVALNYPIQNNYSQSQNVLFNYTVDDVTGISNCSIYIDTILTNTTTTPINHDKNYFAVDAQSEGMHNWTVGCVDNSTAYNSQSATPRAITVDITNPNITLISQLDTLLVTYQTINFTYLPNDTNLKNCSLYANFTGVYQTEAVNASPANIQNNIFIKTISNDGVYVWNVFCTDQSLRTSFSAQNYTLSIDTTSPQYSLNITYPESLSNYSASQQYNFNITWSDNFAISQVILESNFSGDIQNITLTDNFNGVYNFTTAPLSAGDYSYKWYANDSTGHQNSTLQYIYTVAIASPTINLTFNGSEGDISITENKTVNITANILSSDSGYLYLYQDGVLINQGFAPLNNITTFQNPGTYIITSNYSQTQNYTYSETTATLTVNDTIAPLVTPIYPLVSTGTVGSSSVTFQYSVDDYNGISNCELYINGTLNATDSPITKGITETFTKTLTNGTKTYQIKCYDDSNNMGQTQVITFNVTPVAAIGVTINTSRQAYVYNYPVNTTITIYPAQINNLTLTTDIVLGNTSVPWWNTSWRYRKPIQITDGIALTHTEWMTLNVSGLGGNISNCTNEIRLIDATTPTNQSLIASRISGGDNSNYCIVEFNANITANDVNAVDYYVYYNNSNATSTGIGFSPTQIKVQRGTINAASGTILGTAINTINPSDSFLLFTSNSNGTTPATLMFTTNITSQTMINFTRYTATATANITWQVIEHPWINVQRGNATFAAAAAATQVNVTINSVDMTKSFILVNGRVNSATAAQQNRGIISASFISPTRITLRRDTATTAAIADYQVVEWVGATVQNGSTSIGAAAATATVNFAYPGFDKQKTFLVFSTRAVTAANIQDTQVFGRIVNNTQILFNRVGTTGTVSIEYFVVTIPNGTSAAEDISMINSGIFQLTPAISSVTLNKTFSVSSWNITGASAVYNNAYNMVNVNSQTSLTINRRNSTFNSTIATYITQIDLTNFSTYSIGEQEKFIARFINTSDITDGNFDFIWNTSNNITGNYSIITEANAQLLTDGAGHAHIQIITDTTPPNFTFVTPINSFNTSNQTLTFNWTTTDDFSTPINCSININGSVTSGLNTTSGNWINYTVTKNIGTYNWNISCSDNANNSNTTSSQSIVIIGAPTIINVTMAANNQSITLNWTQGYGATSYDIYIKNNYSSNFADSPNFTGITTLNWTDNTANTSTERYYAVATNRTSAKKLSNETVVRKQVALNGSWILASFSYNAPYTRLGNFTLYANPLTITPLSGIKAIYRRNAITGQDESVYYNTTGWFQSQGSGNFTNLELGRGYWFEMNSNSTITYYGIVITNQFNVSLYSGWNILGSTTPVSITLPPLALDGEPPASPFEMSPNNTMTSLWMYDEILNPSNPFVSADHWNDSGYYGWDGDLTTLDPGRGYYTSLSKNATWQVGR